MADIEKNDWVTMNNIPEIVGIVLRVAQDGSWVDVKWPHGSKRQQVDRLTVQTTIEKGDLKITDMTREQELRG